MLRKILHKAGELIMTKTAPQTTEIQYLQRKIGQWLVSKYRRDQINGERYYLGFHDILHRKRTMIGKDGKPVEVHNVPNDKIVDNLYADMVDTKNNYLLSQPVTFVTDNNEFQKELDNIIDSSFLLKLKNIGEGCLNCGISYLYPYYNESGELKFKVFAGHSILPFWKDDEHDEAEMYVRYYEREKKNSITDEIEKRIEVYTPQGIDHYVLIGNTLMIDKDNPHEAYFTKGEVDYTWGDKIPLIPFRYNKYEQPLLRRCKSLQDAINLMTSDFCNNMQDDVRSTILVLENYDGENLGELREKLALFGAIKVRSESGARGDVRTLRIEVDSNNYKAILELLKQAMVQNCRSFDSANLRLGGSPNNTQIQSFYMSMDLDANGQIVQFNLSLDKLFYFIKSHLKEIGKGDFMDEKVKVVFNKDMMISESEIMNNLINAGIRIPNKLLLEQCTFINDVDEAMKLLEEEDKTMMDKLDPYANTKPNVQSNKTNKAAESKLTKGLGK